MTTQNHTVRENYVHPDDLAFKIGPGDSWMVDGTDWAWAFVIYKEVPGYPGTCVGTNGTAWGRGGNRYKPLLDRWKQIKGDSYLTGHIRIRVNGPNGNKAMFIHVAILATFVGPCPVGMQCRHLDGNPTNNRIDNLRWGTPKENMADKALHGTQLRGSQLFAAKLTEENIPDVRRRAAAGETYKSIAEDYGVDGSQITRLMSGEQWRHVDVDEDVRFAVGVSRLIGSGNWSAKLSDIDIPQIRQLYRDGWLQKEIGEEFGVNPATITRIISGEDWGHIPLDATPDEALISERQERYAVVHAIPESALSFNYTDFEVACRDCKVVKSVCDETRILIMFMLKDSPAEISEFREATGFSQPIMSYHLKFLRENGFVTRERSGRKSFFQITERGRVVAEVLEALAKSPSYNFSADAIA